MLKVLSKYNGQEMYSKVLVYCFVLVLGREWHNFFFGKYKWHTPNLARVALYEY